MSLGAYASRAGFIALLAILGLACAPASFAATAAEIDKGVDEALQIFRAKVGGADTLLEKSEGILVFPNIVKAGLVIGGEYGEGALRIEGKTVNYYSTVAASFGFQLGAQVRSLIVIFLEKSALESFRASSGWKVGVDGSIAVVELGAGGALDTTNVRQPIMGVIFNQRGLMGNLTLEGAKFTRIIRE
jgi:lipid-binding SYLF domain-containing protein